MLLAGVTIPFGRDGFVRADEQYVKDAFNTIYIDGLLPGRTTTTRALRSARSTPRRNR